MRRRLIALRAVIVVVFGGLLLRQWQIQVLRGAELRADARDNRYVSQEIEADRGVVYDSRGVQVVFNRPRFTVSIVPGALGELSAAARSAVLDTVAETIGLTVYPRAASVRIGRTGPRDAQGGAQDDAVRAMFRAPRNIIRLMPVDPASNKTVWAGWQAIPIDRNVTREAAFRLMEMQGDLPGVLVTESSVREYPAGPTMAHVLGFTSAIPEEEVDDYRAKGYRIYDTVGRSGIEASYEDVLHGRKGEQVVMVDAVGRPLDEVGGTRRDPVPGANLELAIDLSFQEAAEQALARGLKRSGAKSGAVVAIDPRDGSVRALVTLPTFDNNMFSTGASPEAFVRLLTDPDLPLVNRALTGQPPGSTFKVITASAGLQEGVITAQTRINDPGAIYLPNAYNPDARQQFVCWNRGGHGSLNVVGALAQSCDVFFYQVAGGYYENGSNQPGLGSDRLGTYAKAFGLGALTGIELVGEVPGLVPNKLWLASYNKEYWGTGQTYIMGIGQGYTLATPLQMANAVAAVANGGTLYRPHLVTHVRGADGRDDPRHPVGGEIRRVPVDPANIALVREGMRQAVLPGGTASWAGLPSQIAIAGKTGTAEFVDVFKDADGHYRTRTDKYGNLLTHAWFVAFAPYEAPEIALAVFVDGRGLDHIIEGSQVAAPIAADILRTYFGLPQPAPAATPCTTPPCPTPDGDAAPGAGPSDGAALPPSRGDR
ncbi:MAG: penicillin-binding protein 2 [Ardenticatenales bacterium]